MQCLNFFDPAISQEQDFGTPVLVVNSPFDVGNYLIYSATPGVPFMIVSSEFYNYANNTPPDGEALAFGEGILAIETLGEQIEVQVDWLPDNNNQLGQGALIFGKLASSGASEPLGRLDPVLFGNIQTDTISTDEPLDAEFLYVGTSAESVIFRLCVGGPGSIPPPDILEVLP